MRVSRDDSKGDEPAPLSPPDCNTIVACICMCVCIYINTYSTVMLSYCSQQFAIVNRYNLRVIRSSSKCTSYAEIHDTIYAENHAAMEMYSGYQSYNITGQLRT